MKIQLSAWAAVALSALACAPVLAATSVKLVPCTPATCGGFEQNQSTMTLTTGTVTVGSTGVVTVNLVGLKDTDSGAPIGHRRLELYLGTLLDGQAETAYLGYITTDSFGRYNGVVIGTSGSGFKFGPGTYTGNFLINDTVHPRTEFSSGFAVPN